MVSGSCRVWDITFKKSFFYGERAGAKEPLESSLEISRKYSIYNLWWERETRK